MAAGDAARIGLRHSAGEEDLAVIYSAQVILVNTDTNKESMKNGIECRSRISQKEGNGNIHMIFRISEQVCDLHPKCFII